MWQRGWGCGADRAAVKATSGVKMPDREFDHRKESAGMREAIRQIEERMRGISQAAEKKITKTIRRWSDEQSAKAGGKGVGRNP